MRLILILLGVLLTSSTAHALSPEAEAGRVLYPTCHVCHNPDQIPPLGPPMFGVQRRYIKAFQTKQGFIENMVSFVKHPHADKVVMKEAFAAMGLMPPLRLPDQMLKEISTYIFEKTFAPPCKHWEFAIKRSKQIGDEEHLKKEQRNYARFCR